MLSWVMNLGFGGGGIAPAVDAGSTRIPLTGAGRAIIIGLLLEMSEWIGLY